MAKIYYWKVKIHVLTDFNHCINLIHYLSHNFQRCLGKLKVKVQTGPRNGSKRISNKTVRDKFVALLSYLLKYKLIVCYLSRLIFLTLKRTQHWKITHIDPLTMYQLQYISKRFKLHCHKEKNYHANMSLNLWIKTHCLT